MGINKNIETIWKELQEIDKITRATSTERGVLSDQELVIPSWRSGDSSSTCRAGLRRRNSSLPARGERSVLGPSSPPVSRYSYSARPPRSTIWDYDFSSSQVSFLKQKANPQPPLLR